MILNKSISTLFYDFSVELYKLLPALLLAQQSCAQYTEEYISEAVVQYLISDKMLAEIYKERIKLTETLTKEK